MFTIINKTDKVIVRMSYKDWRRYIEAGRLVDSVRSECNKASLDAFNRVGGDQKVETYKKGNHVDIIMHYPHNYSDF